MTRRSKSKHHISATELASWLRQQGQESWWSVDGDTALCEKASFPCPADELAALFDEESRQPTVLVDTARGGIPEELTAADLDTIAEKDSSGNRVLEMRWGNASIGDEEDWLLIEDREIGQLSSSSSSEKAGS